MERVTKWKAAVVAGCFATLLGVTSSQAFVVSPGNNPQPDEENVLLTQGQSGNPVSGALNQSQFVFNFGSNESLTVPANGQARIVSTDGNGFGVLTITPANGNVTFQDAIFNITLTGTGQRSADLEVTATFADTTTDSVSIPGAIDQGGNFFTVTTGPGESFRSLQIEVSSAEEGVTMETVAQVRISGAACPDDDCEQPRVPEPGTLTLLGGALLGFVGLAGRRLFR